MDGGAWGDTVHGVMKSWSRWRLTPTHTELIFSVVLVSGVQRGDSVTHTPTCLFVYRSFSTTRYYVTVLVARWVWLFATQWSAARQAPLPIGSSKQEYWSRLPCPLPGDLPSPSIEPASLVSPVLAGGFFTPTPFQGWKELQFKRPFDPVSLCFSPFASRYNSKISKIYASGLNMFQYLKVFLLSHSFNRSHQGKISPTSQCLPIPCYAVAQSCLTRQPHGLQHAGIPCPPQSPRACSNSCPLNQRYHSTTSSLGQPPLLLLPSTFPSNRVFSNESALPIR